MGTILIFGPGEELIELDRDSEPELEWMQKQVGGYIEVPIHWTRQKDGKRELVQVILNEDAIPLGLPINLPATNWINDNVPEDRIPNMLGGIVRGTMLVLTGSACMT